MEDTPVPANDDFVLTGKQQAAFTQLKTAIELWFNNGDLSSIHTLTGAARGIVFDLYKKKLGKEPRPFREENLPPGMTRRQMVNAFNAAEAFLKHARNDGPTSVRALSRFNTELHMVLTTLAYLELFQEERPDGLLFAFAVYFVSRHPTYFDKNAIRVIESAFDVEAFRKLPKKLFIRKFLDEFGDGRPL